MDWAQRNASTPGTKWNRSGKGSTTASLRVRLPVRTAQLMWLPLSRLGIQPWSGDPARKLRCTRADRYVSACATCFRKAREMLMWAAVTPLLASQVSGCCPRDGRLCFHHCTSTVCTDKSSKLLHAEESRKKICWLYKNHCIPQLPPNYFLLIGLLLTVFSPWNTVDTHILLRHLLAKIIERRDVRCKTMPSIRETSH